MISAKRTLEEVISKYNERKVHPDKVILTDKSSEKEIHLRLFVPSKVAIFEIHHIPSEEIPFYKEVEFSYYLLLKDILLEGFDRQDYLKINLKNENRL